MSATTRVERLEKQMPAPSDSFWRDLLPAVAKNGRSLVNASDDANPAFRDQYAPAREGRGE